MRNTNGSKFIKCESGGKHDWQAFGGHATERKTGRNVRTVRCEKCRMNKTVFTDTGRRVNR